MTQIAVYVGLAAVFGAGVPWLGIKMLVPALRDSHTATNYRGREVFLGLGVVWLLWAGATIVGGWVIAAGADGLAAAAILPMAGLLALVAFALGLVDDSFGTSAARGFKGHLTALARGRLTTGGMKLLGISLASYVVALVVLTVRANSELLAPDMLFRALPAGAAIALSSNFINLTDLRPGRALKTYSLLAFAGVISSAWELQSIHSGQPGGGPATVLYSAAVLALFAFGPVIAVWRYDVNELGMLGDAGANPAGAVAGLFIVAGLPDWGILVYLAFMLALNLVSERVSFSKVIDGNALLTRLDAMGRPPVE